MGDRLYRCEKCDTLFRRKTGVDDRTICDTCFSHKANRKDTPSYERFGKDILVKLASSATNGATSIDITILFKIAEENHLVTFVDYDPDSHPDHPHLEIGDQIVII